VIYAHRKLGIGFAICKWLVAQGVRHITLIGRSPATPSVVDEINELNSSYKANVVIDLGDVADFESCNELVKRASARAPLVGVFHVAAVMPFLSVMSENGNLKNYLYLFCFVFLFVRFSLFVKYIY
jgi:NAD(P)-dependent dehydrogenase (short-subunit alcohol dehydrogenase family)